MDNLIDISQTNVGGSVETSRPLWEVAIDGYRYVLYSMNKVLVYKGDSTEPAYEIANYSCSCPGDRYSANPCKHRKAVSYLGDGEVEESSTASETSTTSPSIDLNDVM